jgi:hypothetical protein
MRRLVAAALLVATVVAAATTGAASGASGGSGVPRCALGSLTSVDRARVERELTTAERRFSAGLHGSGAAKARAGRTFATALAAYVYGLPPVSVRQSAERFPVNELVSVSALANPSTRIVVAPNADTTYTVARLDLSHGPLVIDVPPTGGRYYVIELLDAYSNAYAYIGRRATGSGAGSFVVVPPGFSGSLPAGVRRIQSPTPLVWVIGRTLVTGPSDLPAVDALMRRYTVTPLASWIAGRRQAPIVLSSFPASAAQRTAIPGGIQFFDALDADLASDPPPAADSCALRAFAAAGIAPGRMPSTATTDALSRAALTAAPKAALRLIDSEANHLTRTHARNGWFVPPSNLGAYGTGYLLRGVTARIALGANSPREAMYPVAEVDSSGRALTGHHRYVVRFAPGELPPVRAFWSITVYDRQGFMVDNPLHRYAIGDRTPGLREARDGSLTILLQHSRPAKGASNWLPTPGGPFRMILRLYQPKPSALSGRWPLPVIRRVG